MEILWAEKVNMSDYGKTCSGEVYSACVSVKDLDKRALKMIESISNTSWLNELRPVAKRTFEARASRTIEKLVYDIKNRVDNQISSEFGEYMVSTAAQDVLESHLSHTPVPLAELLKEKVTGNPGFDFHTETPSSLIAFGEAKYSGKTNPYSNALNQITEFIGLKKDEAELLILDEFVTPDAMDNFQSEKKAVVAAFSINSEEPRNIVLNALQSEHIDELLSNSEVYLIGVGANVG